MVFLQFHCYLKFRRKSPTILRANIHSPPTRNHHELPLETNQHLLKKDKGAEELPSIVSVAFSIYVLISLLPHQFSHHKNKKCNCTPEDIVRRCRGWHKACSLYFFQSWISKWVGSISKQDYTLKLPVISGHPIQPYAVLIGLKLKAKSNAVKLATLICSEQRGATDCLHIL